MLFKKRQKTILIFCGISFIIFGMIPLLLYNAMAFSSEYMLTWIVPFSRFIGWANREGFSISKLVGICYRVSLWLILFLVSLGALFITLSFFKLKKFFITNTIKIIVGIVFLCLSAFYVFAIIVNIMRLDYPAAAAGFYLYIFSEFIMIATLIVTFVVFLRAKNNTTPILIGTNST